MRKREEKLGLVVQESVNGGIVLWKVRNTAGEAESKGQSSASCTVYGFRAEFTYVRTYVQVHIRLYGHICAAMSNICKLAQARPTLVIVTWRKR